MATVTSQPFDRTAADRRVRHPLASVRGYIRTYVTLEGTAIAALYLAAWFWIGLALDYGPFRLFAFDWVQELNDAVGEGTAFVLRAVILAALVLGLAGVVALQIVRRLLREFNDPALALVLERRFPRELGDRLITAVELADPRSAERYGFSQAMIDQTIRDAAERVERVPVRQVFDWARLRKLGLAALLATLGLYLLLFLGYAGYAAANDASAGDFYGRFNTVAEIWAERNVLLQDTYWPRRAYLEVLRFQDSPEHRGEMRIARDEHRPDLLVRAYQWVVADRQALGGWRPLRWEDLPALVDPALLQVPLPDDWGGWILDLDDLDPGLPAGSVPADWQGKSSDQVRQKLREAVAPLLKARGSARIPAVNLDAVAAVERWLRWKSWTVDQIYQQLGRPEKTDVRQPMRRTHPEAVRRFDDVFAALEVLADDPGRGRQLRKLEIPQEVHFTYRGKTTKSEIPHEAQEGNKYTVGLGELKESVRFTVRGDDFYTPPRRITLVPPPGLSDLKLDKDEPAYIYWRVQGDPRALRGKRQHFKNVPVSITGEVSSIPVPLGTSLQLYARTDREIQEGVRLAAPVTRKISGSLTPAVPVSMDGDRQGFRLGFADVTRPMEFELQFLDRDGVKGRRHVVIEPVDDRGPQEVVNVELTVVLRKPRYQAGPGGKAVSGPTDGLLVTPDALLPFKGDFQDDYGLTAMAWEWQGEEARFELSGRSPAVKGQKGKEGELVLGGNSHLRRVGLVVSAMQPLPGPAGPVYQAWAQRLAALDLAGGGKGQGYFAGSASLEVFEAHLAERAGEAVPAAALEEKLHGPPPKAKQFRTHALKQEEGFDFRKHLSRLKSRDPAKEAQLHYRVKLFVSATDNNIETGPTKTLNKVPVTFLVVSENELLSQILLEEEVLRERLEKAVDRLKTGKVILEEQVGKLQGSEPPLSLIGLRADEVRKLLMDSSSATREVSADYGRILREMEVNRVEERRVSNLSEKVVRPLEEVINPSFGNFAATETAVSRLWERVEEDVARLKKAEDAGGPKDARLTQELELRRSDHLKAATEAREQTVLLIDRLEAVLQAIGGELVEREIIAMLVQLERDQRVQAEWLGRLERQLEDELINLLRDPLSK